MIFSPFLFSVGHSIIASNSALVDFSMTTTMMTTTTPAGSNTMVEFEPVLNLPAFGAFLFIAIVFGLLQVRTSQVEAIVQERNRTMANLRALKAQQVSGGGDNPADPVLLQAALDEFERAVQTEERLRNIIPGLVRIVPPSAANDAREQEARRAARQFLGRDYDIGKAESKEENSSSQSGSRGGGGGGEDSVGRGLPPSAVAVLVIVFVSQLALLLFLSQDPMASSSGTNSMMTISAITNFL
jgi:uncharacterized membrane protein YgcG